VKYGIFSDIHGNLPALEGVLTKLKEQGVDQYVCGGDIVGYGANPRECIDIVRNLDCTTIAGNHDWAAIEMINVDLFNIYARSAVLWTREQLSKSDLEYLQSLPLQAYFKEFDKFIEEEDRFSEVRTQRIGSLQQHAKPGGAHSPASENEKKSAAKPPNLMRKIHRQKIQKWRN